MKQKSKFESLRLFLFAMLFLQENVEMVCELIAVYRAAQSFPFYPPLPDQSPLISVPWMFCSPSLENKLKCYPPAGHVSFHWPFPLSSGDLWTGRTSAVVIDLLLPTFYTYTLDNDTIVQVLILNHLMSVRGSPKDGTLWPPRQSVSKDGWAMDTLSVSHFTCLWDFTWLHPKCKINTSEHEMNFSSFGCRWGSSVG